VAVQDFLTHSGQPFEMFQHPRAFTAQEEAAATHVPGRHWAKAVVCVLDTEPVLVVLSADRVIDLVRLREFAGANTARLATEHEFARLYPECEVGAMPPFGPLYNQRVFVDRALTRSDDIVFNAGTHVDGIRMSYEAFAKVVHPLVGDFTLHA
jgi:Ala-tRNA(Pro) deacylase